MDMAASAAVAAVSATAAAAAAAAAEGWSHKRRNTVQCSTFLD